MMGLWLLAGFLVGALNSLTLRWTVMRLSVEMPTSSLTLTLGGMALRLALVAALLVGGLRQGIVLGLLAFSGLWLARTAAVIWFHTDAIARTD